MTGAAESVAITGAGSGIGAELAKLLAAPACTLFLAGRDAGRLESTAAACRKSGSDVRCAAVDVRDGVAVERWIDRIEAERPLGLMIVNAGIFGGRPDKDAFEPSSLAEDIVRTNLIGAIHCAGGIAPRMAARGAGHIVLISSLAAFAPSADAQAYSASKAGLTAYGAALREDMAGRGVRVTLVHPGHVETAQTGQQQGPLPFMIDAADAARRIATAIRAGASEVSFPASASAWVRATAMLPWRVRALLNRPGRFTVRNGVDAGGDTP